MGVCALVNELNRLRKSSGDSIDSDKSFDSFKNYMHIRRNVEDDLKTILRDTNKSGRKTLVLLCGSAGDGKSHNSLLLIKCHCSGTSRTFGFSCSKHKYDFTMFGNTILNKLVYRLYL